MFWDQVAGVYDLFVNVMNRKTHQRLKEIVSALIESEDTVLECACGTGLLSAVIAPRCRSLTATDFSLNMLKKAKKSCGAFPNVSFARADITALSYPDGSFDKVVAGNVIHLLDNPLAAISELNRVCKDGGMLIIPTFSDVKAEDYYYNAVLWAVEKGVTAGVGDGRFGVGQSCTREQAMTFLWAAAGRPEPPQGEAPFSDLRAEDYYYKAVLWAVEKGVTAGVGDGRFGVGQSCTHAEIVTFLYCLLGK